MLYSITFKNFYSFGEETTLNFVVNEKAPDNHGYFKTPLGTRLSKVETVIGPNASGKTNLLKTLPFLKWIIVDSFNLKPDSPLVIQPFAFGDTLSQPSSMSVVFELNGKIYNYSLELNKTRIINEKLERTSFVKEKKGTQKVFSRDWNEQDQKYNFEGENFELPKGFENSLRSNASVIGTAARLNHPESVELLQYWQKIQTNVAEMGWTGDHLVPSRVPQWVEALMFYSENENLKIEAEKLLSRFDLGLNGIVFEKEQKADGLTIKDIKAKHSFQDKEYELPIIYESSGTKQLFVLLKSILSALVNGGAVIIDEFDVNLHPEIVLSLFNLFIDPEINSNNAQLLFSTHSHFVLSRLDKYQIVLVEKNENGMSESWRLDEVTGVRADDNYYSKYIAGAYGAVPKL
jgi:uncharacterized protein